MSFKKTSIPFWLLTCFWYRIIWNFSAQTASVSGDLSDRLLFRLLQAISPAFARSEFSVQTAAVEIISFFERKAAHMFLYFVLAILLWLAFRWTISHWIASAALLSTALLAGLDEYHQTFVAGRSGELRDVLVDCTGALLGLLLLFLLRLELQKRLWAVVSFLLGSIPTLFYGLGGSAWLFHWAILRSELSPDAAAVAALSPIWAQCFLLFACCAQLAGLLLSVLVWLYKRR